MDNKVRNYTDYELLEKVARLKSFKSLPKDYWILGVQSNEDTFNKFDDKFYLYRGKEFIMVLPGTTNAGTTGLLNYQRYNRKGVVVIKTNEWYYGLWRYGLHRGRMPALRQIRPIKYFRDWNKNLRVEEIGKMYTGLLGINFHTVSYSLRVGFFRRLIGGWSTGCAVVNNITKYYKLLNIVKGQKDITYCLIKEF